MPVPDYQAMMLPVLLSLGAGDPQPVGRIRELVVERLHLTPEDLRELVPSGQKPVFHDRIGWALAYLSQAGALARPKRGVYQITERGKTILAAKPTRVDNETLEQFPEFRDFLNRHHVSPGKAKQKRSGPETATPEESLDAAFSQVRAAIEADLLQHVLDSPPEFFERLVVELLVKMGYGGTLKDAGEAIGKSGDGGIDGKIKEDRLGLDEIHIQAKRWNGRTVGRPDIQAFAGSLEGVRARKGIFITTSTFSPEAHDYVSRIDKRIVLIDGEKLAALMYDYGVGVATMASYEVRRVDSDYFGEV